MSRRGASSVIQRHSSKQSVGITSKTFPAARLKLNEILHSFNYIKVIEINIVPPKDGKPSFFHGIGICCQNNNNFKQHQQDKSDERIFFDKGGRLRYNNTLDIGPCKLIDAAWGRDHSTAVPQIGEILVGIFEVNLKQFQGKSRTSKILRSWSKHGKILQELSRIVEFGTRMSEIEIRSILRQSECQLMENKTLNSEDDFWMLSRIVLWGNVRPLVVLHTLQNTAAICKFPPTFVEQRHAADLKISVCAKEFISGIALKLEDVEILNEFQNQFIAEAEVMQPTVQAAAFFGQFYSSTSFTQNTQKGSVTPTFFPSSPLSSPKGGDITYAPSSPPYAPSSPPHAPSSPSYAPSSLPYAPNSSIAPESQSSPCIIQKNLFFLNHQEESNILVIGGEFSGLVGRINGNFNDTKNHVLVRPNENSLQQLQLEQGVLLSVLKKDIQFI